MEKVKKLSKYGFHLVTPENPIVYLDIDMFVESNLRPAASNWEPTMQVQKDLFRGVFLITVKDKKDGNTDTLEENS